jgi:mannose-1-phosphate guanylyltransferase
LFAAILAGGKGQRFWPVSIPGRPKQFIDIAGDGTMLSRTWQRLTSFIPEEKILLLTVEDQIDRILSELPSLRHDNIFVEPEGRNTAPSLAVAALMVQGRGVDETLLCCPADHRIQNTERFASLVAHADGIAESADVLVTFGIVPRYPATGYGYIESGDRYETDGDIDTDGSDPGSAGIFRVRKFHEKPDKSTAESYIEKGNYYWNSGIFAWRPSVYLDAWRRCIPEGAEPLGRIEEIIGSDARDPALSECFLEMPSISVDYGILEKASNVVVVPADFDWNDVGSWDALAEILEIDGSGNAGLGRRELIDSKGCIFYNPEGFTAAIGVEDLIVAVNGTDILVCRRGDSQKVREIQQKIEEKRD